MPSATGIRFSLVSRSTAAIGRTCRLFGDRFQASGYGITIASLPPGTYDLAVFPWSTVLGRFTPAQVVRVTVR